MNFKEYYRDENDFIDDYCKSVDCDACKGTDMNGEPNGYGCEDMENFTGENYEKYMKEEDEIIDLLEQKLAKAEAALKVYEEAVESALNEDEDWFKDRELIEAQQKVKSLLGSEG